MPIHHYRPLRHHVDAGVEHAFITKDSTLGNGNGSDLVGGNGKRRIEADARNFNEACSIYIGGDVKYHLLGVTLVHSYVVAISKPEFFSLVRKIL
jgi:hypothetical protein